MFSVSRLRSFYFAPPVVNMGFRLSRATRTVVAVPKTSIDKNGAFLTDPSNIGLSWDVVPMEPISAAADFPKQLPHPKFRCSIFALNLLHRMATLQVIQVVSQMQYAS